MLVAWQTAVGGPVGGGAKPLLQVAVQAWLTSVTGQAKLELGADGWVEHPAGAVQQQIHKVFQTLSI
jgi:hypothetical protein